MTEIILNNCKVKMNVISAHGGGATINVNDGQLVRGGAFANVSKRLELENKKVIIYVLED